MSQCKLELIQNGLTLVPRTCPTCKLGPCRNPLFYEGPSPVSGPAAVHPQSPATTPNVPERLPIPKALADVLNSYCAENGSNTPDFILGDFLGSVLECLNQAIRERDRWYGIAHRPGGDNQQSEIEFLRKALEQAVTVAQMSRRPESELCLGLSHHSDIQHEVARSFYGCLMVEQCPELAEYLRTPVEVVD